MEGTRGESFTAGDLRDLLGIQGRRSTSAAPHPHGDGDDRSVSAHGGLQAQLARAERDLLQQALRENGDLTRTELAEKLGISVRALYKKLRLYGLTS